MEVNKVFRLTEDQYNNLERQLVGNTNIVVNKDTTELQAGMMLGVQMVLRLLRIGFTVG